MSDLLDIWHPINSDVDAVRYRIKAKCNQQITGKSPNHWFFYISLYVWRGLGKNDFEWVAKFLVVGAACSRAILWRTPRCKMENLAQLWVLNRGAGTLIHALAVSYCLRIGACSHEHIKSESKLNYLCLPSINLTLKMSSCSAVDLKTSRSAIDVATGFPSLTLSLFSARQVVHFFFRSLCYYFQPAKLCIFTLLTGRKQPHV